MRELPDVLRKASLPSAEGEHTEPQAVNFISVCGKVMEQLILKTISRYMEDKKIIRSSKHGFTFYDGRTSL